MPKLHPACLIDRQQIWHPTNGSDPFRRARFRKNRGSVFYLETVTQNGHPSEQVAIDRGKFVDPGPDQALDRVGERFHVSALFQRLQQL
jgi:hypothetical protein